MATCLELVGAHAPQHVTLAAHARDDRIGRQQHAEHRQPRRVGLQPRLVQQQLHRVARGVTRRKHAHEPMRVAVPPRRSGSRGGTVQAKRDVALVGDEEVVAGLQHVVGGAGLRDERGRHVHEPGAPFH